MVFCYQNCSDLLWEKNGLVIKKKIWIQGLRSRICKSFEITRTIYSNKSNKSEQLEFKLEKLLGFRNMQEKFKKELCHEKLFWTFTVQTNCSNDIKMFADSQPSASNFKSFSRILEQFFLTVSQGNFGYKIPFHLLQNIVAFSEYMNFKNWHEIWRHFWIVH